MAKKLDTSKVDIYEIDTQDIVERVEKTVLQYNGKGFTIEVLPEITTHKTYKGYVPLLNSAKYAYRPDWFRSATYRGTSLEIASHLFKIDWNAVISKEVDISYNSLPKGIAINKAPKSTLLDDRDTSHNHLGVSSHADYMEGHRMTISVSDEYAAKIFKEVYADVGFPFRDLLLTKYGHILNKVANVLHDKSYYFTDDFAVKYGAGFFVDDSHAGATSGGLTGFETLHYEPELSVIFTEFDMKPLASWGQKYGMALAIIETLKNKHPKYRNAIFYISHKFDCYIDRLPIIVDYRIPQQPIAEGPQELNDW